MTQFEQVVRHIIARNQMTIDMLFRRNEELRQVIIAEKTGEGKCPVCAGAGYAGVSALIYHDNEHVWPEYAGGAMTKMIFHDCRCSVCGFEWTQGIPPALCPRCHSDKTVLVLAQEDNLPPKNHA